jgi:hypothetical protein
MSSVREYAKFLLTTSPNPDGGDLDVDAAREREAGGLTGCREAVEILTRNPKKRKPVVTSVLGERLTNDSII